MWPAPHPVVRLANLADRQIVSTLVRFEEQVHAHLDWRPVEEWLGTQPFLLAEQSRRPVAALACPPDPENTAWLRLFVVAERTPQMAMWDLLWSRAEAMLAGTGVQSAAVVSLEGWIDALCLRVGFQHTNTVVVLTRPRSPITPRPLPAAFTLRRAQPADAAAIITTDLAAFAPPWQNSAMLLHHALGHADYLTVVEHAHEVVAYQLTTSSGPAAHLARLAVAPAWQGRGLGASLVADLVQHYNERGTRELTVNTQANNTASLAVYQRLGFRPNGVQFPIYQFLFE